MARVLDRASDTGNPFKAAFPYNHKAADRGHDRCMACRAWFKGRMRPPQRKGPRQTVSPFLCPVCVERGGSATWPRLDEMPLDDGWVDRFASNVQAIEPADPMRSYEHGVSQGSAYKRWMRAEHQVQLLATLLVEATNEIERLTRDAHPG